MDVKFHDNIETHVPTCCLIEDFWMLRRALNHLEAGDLAEAKDAINCAMDCLAESIERYTKVPAGLEITPSQFSAIAMCCENGIIMDGNKDLRCRAGKCLSDAGGCYCDTCPYARPDEEALSDCRCVPEDGYILLENGVIYDATGDAEEFIAAMEAAK